MADVGHTASLNLGSQPVPDDALAASAVLNSKLQQEIVDPIIRLMRAEVQVLGEYKALRAIATRMGHREDQIDVICEALRKVLAGQDDLRVSLLLRIAMAYDLLPEVEWKLVQPDERLARAAALRHS